MTETIFNACVNILAVEFLIKKNDRESYDKYRTVLCNIFNNEEYKSEKDVLEICLPLNKHIRNLGEMITRKDYDEQKELLFEILKEVLENEK